MYSNVVFIFLITNNCIKVKNKISVIKPSLHVFYEIKYSLSYYIFILNYNNIHTLCHSPSIT